MSEAYAEQVGEGAAVRHCYVYVPDHAGKTAPAPVIVFFHGSGGNFKGYLWMLRELAERSGCVLVAPTGGIGNWNEATSAQALELALEGAAAGARIDPEAVHLVGLSNGGLALTHLLAAHDLRFRSVAAVSPVLGDLPAGRDVRVLMLTGGADDRVPLEYVAARAAEWRGHGAQVELVSVPGADHFLIFSHRAQVIARLGQWLARNQASSP